MKSKLLLVLSLALGLQANAANLQKDNKGYSIQLDVPSKKEAKAYLVSYWNGMSYAVDSVQLSSEGQGVLQNDTRLAQGQYLVFVKPDVQVDILIGDQQSNIKLEIDPSNINNCKSTGSNDTKLLWEYLSKQAEMQLKVYQLETQENEALEVKSDEQAKKLELEFEKYTKSLIKKNKGSWFGAFLGGLTSVDLPFHNPKNETESTANIKFARKNFFNNVNMEDPRMWTTNYYAKNIDIYMDYWSHNAPDSLATSACKLVEMSKGNDFTFQQMLSKLTNDSQRSKLMGRENVWAKLYEEYIVDKNLDWIDSMNLMQLEMSYELLKKNRIGMKASNMRLQGVNGEIINTNEIKAEYLMLYFYDTSCAHCIEETPKLLSKLEQFKQYNLKMVAINLHPASEENHNEWIKYIDKNKMGGIYNCNDPEFKSNYWLNYDTSGTPCVYLLDKDKNIIGRKLGSENIPAVLDFYIR